MAARHRARGATHRPAREARARRSFDSVVASYPRALGGRRRHAQADSRARSAGVVRLQRRSQQVRYAAAVLSPAPRVPARGAGGVNADCRHGTHYVAPAGLGSSLSRRPSSVLASLHGGPLVAHPRAAAEPDQLPLPQLPAGRLNGRARHRTPKSLSRLPVEQAPRRHRSRRPRRRLRGFDGADRHLRTRRRRIGARAPLQGLRHPARRPQAGDDNPLLLMRLAVRPLAQPPFPLEWLSRLSG